MRAFIKVLKGQSQTVILQPFLLDFPSPGVDLPSWGSRGDRPVSQLSQTPTSVVFLCSVSISPSPGSCRKGRLLSNVISQLCLMISRVH